MNENWCKEHQTEWFKKGAMKNYAHPILDENGEKTGEWCNKPKEQVSSVKSFKGKSPEEVRSIEGQVAVKAVVELWIAGKLADNSPEVMAVLVWICDKLSSPPETNPKEEQTSMLATKTQLNRILEIQQIKGIPVTMITDKVKDWGKEKTKDLTSKQADDLIKILEKS